MKSLTAVCPSAAGTNMPAINPQGRSISRQHQHHHHPHNQHPQRENAEMKMYLSKLKDLVPFMPKNRKLSKLEIIQHVIDYICDLQTELETHPEINNFDAASALNYAQAAAAAAATQNDSDNGSEENEDDDDMEGDEELLELESHELAQRLNGEEEQQQQQQTTSPARKPLVDRQAPNTILPANAAPAMAFNNSALQQQQQQQQQQLQQTQLLQQQLQLEQQQQQQQAQEQQQLPTQATQPTTLIAGKDRSLAVTATSSSSSTAAEC